eukprot:TRINITY_DN2346_c0_g1_i1.p1 TRINITY_DN2346_c0_g1~~TRINITY_DN2346_c0_g1_i1.p1  ORF type:complete len:356 (-),score=61.62 TRINITY_DN2346_c0_g1_i1:198-1265(-)
MSLQVQVNVPAFGWDYIPLPNLGSSATTNSYQYEVIFLIPLPSFLSKWWRKNDIQLEPQFVVEARQLIKDGRISLCEEGVGGTYFVKKEDGSVLAVFKPEDEEPGSSNNPKGKVKDPLLPPGTGAIREVAAHFLDRGFAGVPNTYYISNIFWPGGGEKRGSLQEFIPNVGVSSDLGYSLFNLDSVQRIAILDIRMFNLDRNGENLLVTKKVQTSPEKYSTYDLVPIDHAYCLPPIDSLTSPYFEWHYWPQAKNPFSEENLAYIRSIDIEGDALKLRELGLPEDCIGTMVVCTLLLKKAADAKMTLFDIASLMTSNDSSSSQLQQMITAAEEKSFSNVTVFTDEFEKILNQHLFNV